MSYFKAAMAFNQEQDMRVERVYEVMWLFCMCMCVRVRVCVCKQAQGKGIMQLPAQSMLFCEPLLSWLHTTVPWESEEKWEAMDSWCERECL